MTLPKRSEADVKRSIEEFLKRLSIPYLRLNAGDRMVGKYRIRGVPTGTPDIVLFPINELIQTGPLTPIVVWCETKSSQGTLSKEQQEFRDAIVNRPCQFYLLARSADAVLSFLRERGVI